MSVGVLGSELDVVGLVVGESGDGVGGLGGVGGVLPSDAGPVGCGGGFVSDLGLGEGVASVWDGVPGEGDGLAGGGLGLEVSGLGWSDGYLHQVLGDVLYDNW